VEVEGCGRGLEYQRPGHIAFPESRFGVDGKIWSIFEETRQKLMSGGTTSGDGAGGQIAEKAGRGEGSNEGILATAIVRRWSALYRLYSRCHVPAQILATLLQYCPHSMQRHTIVGSKAAKAIVNTSRAYQ
jgi:hypothetical protein